MLFLPGHSFSLKQPMIRQEWVTVAARIRLQQSKAFGLWTTHQLPMRRGARQDLCTGPIFPMGHLLRVSAEHQTVPPFVSQKPHEHQAKY